MASPARSPLLLSLLVCASWTFSAISFSAALEEITSSSPKGTPTFTDLAEGEVPTVTTTPLPVIQTSQKVALSSRKFATSSATTGVTIGTWLTFWTNKNYAGSYATYYAPKPPRGCYELPAPFHSNIGSIRIQWNVRDGNPKHAICERITYHYKSGCIGAGIYWDIPGGKADTSRFDYPDVWYGSFNGSEQAIHSVQCGPASSSPPDNCDACAYVQCPPNSQCYNEDCDPICYCNDGYIVKGGRCVLQYPNPSTSRPPPRTPPKQFLSPPSQPLKPPPNRLPSPSPGKLSSPPPSSPVSRRPPPVSRKPPPVSRRPPPVSRRPPPVSRSPPPVSRNRPPVSLTPPASPPISNSPPTSPSLTAPPLSPLPVPPSFPNTSSPLNPLSPPFPPLVPSNPPTSPSPSPLTSPPILTPDSPIPPSPPTNPSTPPIAPPVASSPPSPPLGGIRSPPPPCNPCGSVKCPGNSTCYNEKCVAYCYCNDGYIVANGKCVLPPPSPPSPPPSPPPTASPNTPPPPCDPCKNLGSYCPNNSQCQNQICDAWCYCNVGFVYRDGRCVRSVPSPPPLATPAPSPPPSTCSPCTASSCPSNSQCSTVDCKAVCTCNTGYVFVNNTCVLPPSPPSPPLGQDLGCLDPHNAARAAVGVPNLKWNYNLYKAALTWANTIRSDCTFRLSSYPYGENVYMIKGGVPEPTCKTAVDFFVSQKQFYNHETNTCKSGEQCAQYTQVVWKNTTSFACAKATCRGSSAFIWVCEYNPPGNYEGQKPY